MIRVGSLAYDALERRPSRLESGFPTCSEIFGSGPSRRAITPGQKHIRVRQPSKLAQAVQACESEAEAILVMFAELDALAVKAQPWCFRIPSPDGAFDAYPDVATISMDGRLALHDVTSAKRTMRRDTQIKYELARSYYAAHGVDYYFWLNEDLYETTTSEMVMRLGRFVDRPVPSYIADDILDYVRRARICTIADIMCDIHFTDHFDIYALIRQRNLIADLSIQLGYETRVRLPTFKIQLPIEIFDDDPSRCVDVLNFPQTSSLPSEYEAQDPIFASILHPQRQKVFPWERAQQLTPKQRILAHIPGSPNDSLKRWF